MLKQSTYYAVSLNESSPKCAFPIRFAVMLAFIMSFKLIISFSRRDLDGDLVSP